MRVLAGPAAAAGQIGRRAEEAMAALYDSGMPVTLLWPDSHVFPPFLWTEAGFLTRTNTRLFKIGQSPLAQ